MYGGTDKPGHPSPMSLAGDLYLLRAVVIVAVCLARAGIEYGGKGMPRVAAHTSCSYSHSMRGPAAPSDEPVLRRRGVMCVMSPYAYMCIHMLPPRSYRPPIATRGPRLATWGRKLPRSSLGFRGALWGVLRALLGGWKIPNSYQVLFATRGASRVLIATRYPASPPPRSYPSYQFRDMFATVCVFPCTGADAGACLLLGFEIHWDGE
eukprot:scaffold9726_cov119-Isochrysis_galbana.AAC.21